MSEHAPSGEPAYEYPDARTEALHLVVAHGWGEVSDGAPDAPTGAFATVHNDVADIYSIQDAFGDVLQDLGLSVADISGHFLVTVKDDEPVRYAEFEDHDTAHGAWVKLQAAYLRWQAGLPPQAES